MKFLQATLKFTDGFTTKTITDDFIFTDDFIVTDLQMALLFKPLRMT